MSEILETDGVHGSGVTSDASRRVFLGKDGVEEVGETDATEHEALLDDGEIEVVIVVGEVDLVGVRALVAGGVVGLVGGVGVVGDVEPVGVDAGELVGLLGPEGGCEVLDGLLDDGRGDHGLQLGDPVDVIERIGLDEYRIPHLVQGIVQLSLSFNVMAFGVDQISSFIACKTYMHCFFFFYK